MKILMVDDEEFFPFLVAVWLARAGGFDLHFAADGDAALRSFEERGPFDVVLTDFYHPGANGLELAKTLRKRNPRQGVVMFTGGVPDAVARSCKKLGIPILWKASRGQELPQLLQAAMRNKNRKLIKVKRKKVKKRKERAAFC